MKERAREREKVGKTLSRNDGASTCSLQSSIEIRTNAIVRSNIEGTHITIGGQLLRSFFLPIEHMRRLYDIRGGDIEDYLRDGRTWIACM